MTPHNEAQIEDIAETVLMPGDPLRAKYIVDNYMTDVKLINSVRNMYGYTGNYKGKRITVFASGMGMPSMGIYCYELYKFYNVQNIIRIGSCGAYSPDLNIFDTVLVDRSYTEGIFAFSLEGKDCHIVDADDTLNNVIIKTYNSLLNTPNPKLKNDNLSNFKLYKGNILCSEVFDYYVNNLDELMARFPKDLNIIGAEMESFALFYIAKYLNRKASCLLTVVDSHYKKQEISAEDREKSLNNMIELALESAIKL